MNIKFFIVLFVGLTCCWGYYVYVFPLPFGHLPVQSSIEFDMSAAKNKKLCDELFANEYFSSYLNIDIKRFSDESEDLARRLSMDYRSEHTSLIYFLEEEMHDGDKLKILLVLEYIAEDTDIRNVKKDISETISQKSIDIDDVSERVRLDIAREKIQVQLNMENSNRD